MDRYLRHFKYSPIGFDEKDDDHLRHDLLMSSFDRRLRSLIVFAVLVTSSCIALISSGFIAYQWHRGDVRNPLFPQALYCKSFQKQLQHAGVH
jgi:hypothetical protein